VLDHVSVLDWPTVIVAGVTEMLTVGGTGGGELLFPPPQACSASATATATATAGRRSRVSGLVMIADMLLVLQVCYGAGAMPCRCSPPRAGGILTACNCAGTFVRRVTSHGTRSVGRAIYSSIRQSRRDK
jgi:hypothetical protein